jgi:hypothetical protein
VVIERAREQSAEIRRILDDSERRSDDAKRVLRRAGYLS